MVARCPVRQNFSGGRGIHSAGVRLALVGAPSINSFCASDNLDSSSITQENIKTSMVIVLLQHIAYLITFTSRLFRNFHLALYQILYCVRLLHYNTTSFLGRQVPGQTSYTLFLFYNLFLDYLETFWYKASLRIINKHSRPPVEQCAFLIEPIVPSP